LKLLENYRGVVQCDGYAAYKTIADKPCGKAITLAFCWSVTGPLAPPCIGPGDGEDAN
jgi:Transposase IS66 family